MSTWAKNDSELLGFLTGFEGRDAFSIRQHLPVVSDPNTGDAVEGEKPPLEAQNAVLGLGYEVLAILRKWLQDNDDDRPPTASELMRGVDGLFSEVTRPMVEPTGAEALSASSPEFVVLRTAVEGLVTEAWVERLRKEFVSELARSRKKFQTRLAKDSTERDDWRDELDGGVVLYDVFRPNLWEAYQKFWDQWSADMARIHALTTRLQGLDEALMQEEDS